MDRVRADHGFIALDWAEAGTSSLRVVAREGLSDNLSTQLGRWYRTSVHAGEDLVNPVLFSRLAGNEPLLEAVPALRDRVAGCLFMPITLEGKRFGVLYLGRSSLPGGEAAFGRPALDFLATYMGFLALFLFEKGGGGCPVTTRDRRRRSRRTPASTRSSPKTSRCSSCWPSFARWRRAT